MTLDGKGHHIDTNSELPPTWVWVTLGSLVLSMKNGIYKPASAYTSDGIPCLRMYNIADGRVIWRDIKRMRLSDKEVTEYKLCPGDIIVNRVNSRELVGKSAVIIDSTERSVFESKNIRIRVNTDLAVPEFLNYRLLFARRAYFSQNAQQVVGMASISQPQVAGFPVPLPPLNEQRRIVSEIERQFSILDAGVEALKRVQAKLKRYRASVLQAACTGRLVPTEAELARLDGRVYEPASALTTCIREGYGKTPRSKPPANETVLMPLPEGWCWTTIGSAGTVRLGRQRSPKNRADQYPTPYIRAANITENGLRLDDVLEMDFKPHERETYQLEPGDLVLSEASGSANQVGKPAVWKGEISGCCFQNTVIRFRPHMCSSAYSHLVFLHFYTNRVFAQVAAGVGINHLGADRFSSIPFPLPPLAEQHRITAEVDQLLSSVDETGQVVAASLERAGRLRQSILKEAFEGRLVPQDPTDEPAGHLLERIKEARAETSGRNGARPRRGRPELNQPALSFPVERPSSPRACPLILCSSEAPANDS